MATLKNTTIDNTGALILPKGTSAQRPVSPSTGMMRYNTDYNRVEIYIQNYWYYI
jgi:hypothetical protein